MNLNNDSQNGSTSIDEPFDDTCNQLLVCQWSDLLRTPIYVGFGWVYSVAAVTTRGIFMTGLFKALAKEPNYFWQALFGLSDFLDVCCFAFYLILNGFIQEWEAFIKCYSCVWVVVKFSVPAYDFGCTNTLLMSIIMASDRLLSLAFPIAYARLVSNRIRIPVAVCCVCVSILVNGFDYMAFRTEELPGGGWKMATDFEFIDTKTAKVWITTQNFVLITGTALLAILNVLMLQRYKRRLSYLNSITVDRRKYFIRKRDEQILTTLTSWQCLFVGVNVSVTIAYYTVANYVVSPCSCYYMFVAIATDTICMAVRLFDIYVCLAMNKCFRDLFKSGLSTFCCCKFLQYESPVVST